MIAMLERDGLERTNGERSGNGTQFADHSLSIADEPRGAPCRRFGYWERQIQPNPRYSGVCDSMTDDEAAALLGDLLNRFDLDYWALPPTGLPGFVRDGYDAYSRQADLIDLGVSYLIAMIRNEPRAMHLRWQEAAEFIKEIEDGIRAETITEWLSSNRDDVERKQDAQLVYFIAASSGPVKIGIAIHPMERLKTLQTSHHERLELLATCKGGQPLERDYHKRFASRRLSGEWFERCPEIEAEIERLNNAV